MTITPSYDPANIFARILHGEIPCDKIYEDEFTLAFHDIAPHAPIHALVIPKGHYVNLYDFSAHADAATITGFWRAVATVVTALKLNDDGYRMIANSGAFGGQEVPHFHVHLLGGRPLGKMLAAV